MYFRYYGLRKPWLDKYLKSPVSEDPSKSNMVNEPKHCSNLNHSTLAYLLIKVKATESEKLSLNNMQIFLTGYEHIDCRPQFLSS